MLLSHAFVTKIALENYDLDAAKLEFRAQLQSSDKQLQMFSSLLQQELEQDGCNGAIFTESVCTALAVYLIQNYAVISKPVRKLTKNQGLSQRQLKQSLDFISESFATTISLQTLADQLGLSSYYFARQFKQSTGQSPYQYIKNLRLERAKVLLDTKPHLSITSIAFQLGFADHSHFTKQFRERYKLTPSDYRNRHL